MLVAIASYKNNRKCRELFLDMLKHACKRNPDTVKYSENIDALRTTIGDYSNWINTEHRLIEHVGNKVRDRGRADIWIGNSSKDNRSSPSYRLIIENKIYADNQDRQLRRYFRYLIGDNRINAGLFYLCLTDDQQRKEGAKKSAEPFYSESGSKKDEETKYVIITYKNDIANWLKQIIELKDLEPNFKTGVEQYFNIVEQITK